MELIQPAAGKQDACRIGLLHDRHGHFNAVDRIVTGSLVRRRGGASLAHDTWQSHDLIGHAYPFYDFADDGVFSNKKR